MGDEENGVQSQAATEPVAQEPVQEPVSDPAPSDPVDLNEAFKILRDQNKETTDPAVQPGEGEGLPSDDVPGDAQPGGEAAPGPELGSAGTAGDAGHQAADPGIGGAATTEPEVDYSVYGKSLMDSINKQAMQETAAKFQEMKIRKMNVTDLYSRDERSGTVTFRNPDDERNPFRSRMEAQQWCDSFNSQIEYEFRNMAQQQQKQLLQQYQPTLRLVEFAHKFNAMDEDVKDVFNQIIEPYAVQQNGQTIGYSCNLNKAAEKALTIVENMKKRYAPKPQQQPAAQQQKAAAPAVPGSGPATDMRTGSNSGGAPQEPKDLQEAMKMYNAQKRGK